MGTDETAPTGGAEHAEPQHNDFAHELLEADPAVPDVGPGEKSGQAADRDVDDEDRFDAG
jgi:hypothetical protein